MDATSLETAITTLTKAVSELQLDVRELKVTLKNQSEAALIARTDSSRRLANYTAFSAAALAMAVEEMLRHLWK